MASLRAMTEAKRPLVSFSPPLALAIYGLVVVVPLVVLFARAAWYSAPPPAPAAIGPAAMRAGGSGVPQTAEPASSADGLPPFDAFGTDEAPIFPDLRLAAIAETGDTRLSALRRGPAIVHLWSLSCETCADEWAPMSAFARLGDASGKGEFPPLVSVLVVQDSAGRPGPTGRTALEAVRRDGWFGRQAQDVTAAWAVAEEDVLSGAGAPTPELPMTGYPETFVLDGRGRIRLRLVGPVSWALETWRHLLEMIPDLG